MSSRIAHTTSAGDFDTLVVRHWRRGRTQFVRTTTWARSERGSCFASCLSCFSDGAAETSECRKQNCVTGSTCLAWESGNVCSMKPLLPHQRCHYKLTARVRRIQWNRERRWRFRRFRWEEVSRARQCLTGATIAAGTDATLQEMQSRKPQGVVRNITQRIMEWQPEAPVVVDRKVFVRSLKSVPRGSSPGPGGCTFEHLRCLLDETETTEMLHDAVCSFARASLPVEISTVLMSARLTALNKPDGGVRGIATGCSLRRLVARALAKQFGSAFEAECAPFQYALSTRAGTDCVGHMLRAATDDDPSATILSVDGIGAYDHILRSAMLERLATMREVSAILPFVRLSYGTPSRYSWWDEAGQRRTVTQAEGGEQGDPLMPYLFSIGIQGALEEVAATLQPGEQLCAFLDDVYALCQPDRVKAIYDTLAECLRVAGIRLHQGKTRVWNRGGVQPADVALSGPDVWEPQGVMVLGTPIGSPQFTADRLQTRIEEERRLWEAIPYVSDLQCGWQILLQSANPRANHTLRTVPPSLSREYAVAHDDGLWGTAHALLGEIPGSADELSEAKSVPTLPMRMGGLGLRCAERIREAAYWSSWADALSMIHHRNPSIADLVVERLDHGPLEGCLEELAESTRKLDDEGFWWRPSWTQLRAGGRPPQVDVGGKPGEWQHGWQIRASGRGPYCLTGLLLVGPICAPTQDATQGRHWHMLPRPRSTRSLLTCFGR